MKNSLIESLRKIRRSGNIICGRLTTSRIIIGVLSITIVLCSLISTFAEVTSIHALAVTASTGVTSVTKRILVPIDTSTLAITITIPIPPDPTPVTPTPTPITPTPTPITPTPTPVTPTPTPVTPTPTPITPTPTPTRVRPTPTPTMVTPTPTPTMVITPTPTSTTTNSPSPTNTPTSSPRVTTTTTSSSSYVPPGITPTATAIVTPGTTSTATGVVSTPDSSQGQTQAALPSDSSAQSIGQEQKNTNFPFTQLIIGLLGSAAAIYLVFIGRLYLNNRMQVKSSSSGAYSWSGELTNTTSWDLNRNSNFNFNDSNRRVSNSSTPLGYDGATGIMSQESDGDWPSLQNDNYAPSNGYDDLGSFAPTNWSSSPMYNDPAYVPPSTPHPELFEPQEMGLDTNSHERGADEQWLNNNPEGYPDFNDPYLQGLLKEYSEKSKDVGQQRDVDGWDK